MNPTVAKLLAFASLLTPLSSMAQDLSPRAYWPAPVGTSVASMGYVYGDGDMIPDRSLPVTGVDSQINSLHLGYRHTTDVWGRTANFIVEVPYVAGTTVGKHTEMGAVKRNYSGVGDVSASLSINLLGAPAMNRAEFQEMRRNPHAILGASIKVVAPTGDYSSDHLINVGANRWAMKAELGYITMLAPKWLLEVSVGGWFFADNNDFLDTTKEQAPVVTVQGHLIHEFRSGFWASLDANYYEGGRSTIDGQRLDNLQRDSKLGATMVFPFAGKHAVKLSYSTGSINDSDEQFDTFLISYSRVF